MFNCESKYASGHLLHCKFMLIMLERMRPICIQNVFRDTINGEYSFVSKPQYKICNDVFDVKLHASLSSKPGIKFRTNGFNTHTHLETFTVTLQDVMRFFVFQ